jgi:multimeric flavodoxin WrbA
MGKEILVLTGSPRRKGNSDQLADAFIRGAAEQGHGVHKFEAAYKNISGCRACNMCWSSGTDPCVVKDDFYELAPLLESCETVVFVSPVYSQWGLIPKITLERGSLGAVRIGNTHNKMVVDPTVK